MVDFMNWCLTFMKSLVTLLFTAMSSDGRSLGYMLLGITIVGAVVAGTIAGVGIFARRRW